MTTIEHIVMARVRRIHTIRRFMHPTLLKVYGGVLLMGVLASTVSLANIFANMSSLATPAQVVRFIVAAVTHTEVVVQIITGGVVVLCILLVRDIVKNSKQGVFLQHA